MKCKQTSIDGLLAMIWRVSYACPVRYFLGVKIPFEYELRIEPTRSFVIIKTAVSQIIYEKTF
jgi:hypothetical protein